MKNEYENKGIVNGNRVPVNDITVAPYNSMVAIPSICGESIVGNAVVIGKNKLLASATTCVSLMADNYIYPQLNATSSPYGGFKIESVNYPLEFDSGDNEFDFYNLAFDYAVIKTLPNENGVNIGDLVPSLDIATLNVADLVIGNPIRALGYPNDKGFAKMWESPGVCLSDTGDYYQMSQDAKWIPRFMAIDCDVVPGNIGGVVLNEHNEVIGLVTLKSEWGLIFYGESQWGNGALIFTSDVVKWITEQ